jgi:hypothetical protein
MSFKQPEILYALLLLLIPIIIHLVRWKKYKQELFTNVDFLKDLEIKSRRSRKLKELLVLLTRLLAFASLIVAFAQPFFASKSAKNNLNGAQTVIYADNSLSMSAPTQNTNLWQEVVQDLVKNIDENATYTFFTNTQTYKNINGKRFKEILFNTPFVAQNTHHNLQLKKGNFLFENARNKQQNFVYISDFQNVDNQKIDTTLFDKNINYQFYVKQVKDLPNMSIDTIWLQNQDADNYVLQLKLSANSKELQSPVSILQGKKLLWRGYVDFKDSLQQQITVQLPFAKQIEAELSINDKGFQFDNKLFFSIHQPEKTNILLIGNKLPDFVKKIYTADEFVLDFAKANNINYAKLEQYSLIILNEISQVEAISADALQKYVSNYGNLMLIPPSEKPEKMAKLLSNLHLPLQVQLDSNKVFLNKIHFSHPFFKKVFLKRTSNFAYPYVKKHLQFATNGNWLYQLSDGTAFAQIIDKKGKIIVLNGGLSIQNSNFTEAPYLLVPLFYQAGKIQQNTNELYYNIGQKNSFTVHTNLSKDAVLKLRKGKQEMIPMQVNQFDKVQLSTTDFPSDAGVYEIVKNDTKISTVAYNFDRKEQEQKYIDLPTMKNIKILNSFEHFVAGQKEYFKEQSVWKYFVILALFFLLIEMLLIRFWK